MMCLSLKSQCFTRYENVVICTEPDVISKVIWTAAIDISFATTFSHVGCFNLPLILTKHNSTNLIIKRKLNTPVSPKRFTRVSHDV
jgi:hypothetical protein